MVKKKISMRKGMEEKNIKSGNKLKIDKKLFWIIVIAIIIIAIVILAVIQFYTGYAVGGVLCEDSDAQEISGVYPRGINIYEEGKATRASLERVDYCAPLNEDPQGKNLREYYCQNAGLIHSRLVKCDNGCANGACVR